MENVHDARASAARLSSSQERFVRFVEHHPECLSRSSFRSLEESSRAFMDYPIQSWPVFVDQQRASDLERISVGLAELVRAIPGRIFRNDPRRLSQFYRISSKEALDLVAKNQQFGVNDLLMRADLVLSAAGFQCVEINAASNLGGWEASFFAEEYLYHPLIKSFLTEQRLEASYRNTIDVLFSHLIDCSMRGVPAGGREWNIAFPAPGGNEAPKSYAEVLTKAYGKLLRQQDKSFSGEIFLCTYEDLQETDACLFYGTKRVHLVLEQHVGFIPQSVSKCWAAGNVVVLNGPLGSLLSDKRNLAILSEFKNSAYFETHEKSLIDAHVPWTRVLRAGPTMFGGEQVDLPSLLTDHREAFVIKPGLGIGGEEVYVGRFVSEACWTDAVGRALSAGGWVAQEYVKPVSLPLQHGDHGWAPFDLVWGAFMFGRSYGGSFLRAVLADSEGVINSSRGAIDAVLFEVGVQ